MADEMTIVLDQQTDKQTVSLMHGDVLMEYYQADAIDDSLVGRIYLGTVERVLPDIKAAFIKFGRKHNGFLPLNESPSFHQAQGNDSLKTGDEVIVQVKKDEKGDKGAFLTRDIAFPGEYVLLMPLNRFVGISKRIESPKERDDAKQIGHALANRRCGVIVRHASLFASMEEMQEEVDTLLSKWEQIKQSSVCLKAPALLHQDASNVQMLIREYHARYALSVVSNQPKLSDMGDDIPWQTLGEVDFSAYLQGKSIDRQCMEALARVVPLIKGGSLVIDEREALQTIDVNSGSVVQKDMEQSVALWQNLNAVDEIARQIRLRNLSGILLIDFIDMKNDEERQIVQEALQKAIVSDRVKQVVHGFTKLGFLEMTRKRTRDSLRDLLTKPCKHCHQSGYIPLASQRKG